MNTIGDHKSFYVALLEARFNIVDFLKSIHGNHFHRLTAEQMFHCIKGYLCTLRDRPLFLPSYLNLSTFVSQCKTLSERGRTDYLLALPALMFGPDHHIVPKLCGEIQTGLARVPILITRILGRHQLLNASAALETALPDFSLFANPPPCSLPPRSGD